MGKLGQLNNIVVRRYVKETDLAQVEALERSCEAGLGASLFADMLGDPLCRVRHLPVHTMLVAEVAKQIVGVVRGGVNDVVCRSKKISDVSEEDASSVTIVPVYARVGYLLGLRVCPLHRYLLTYSLITLEAGASKSKDSSTCGQITDHSGFSIVCCFAGRWELQ